MAGLFELQLPNESRARRSQDVPEPRRSISGRPNSPSPEVTAKEIVSQVVAKQQAAAAAAANSTSIFPWRRRATAPGTSRKSSDGSSRNSAEASSRSISQSPDRQKKYGNRLSPRRAPAQAHDPVSPTSPRTSSSIDFTLTPSSPNPELEPGITSNTIKDEDTQPRAASALAHAGLGLGLPPIAFPGPSSPVPRTSSRKGKTSNRPGTSHGPVSASASNSSLKVQSVRRAKSFSKHEAQSVGEPSRTVGKDTEKRGDVLVFTRDRTFSAAVPHAHSMPEWSPEWSPRDPNSKGKARELVSDEEGSPVGLSSRANRGRQATSQPSLAAGDRDKSVSRRTSWWPSRRRLDSSPAHAERPPISPISPPPIPQRSQIRPKSAKGATTPSLPSFRPFSPLMGSFGLSGSPSPSVTSFEERSSLRPRGLNDPVSGLDGDEGTIIRRRHSLNNRTGGTHSYIPSISIQASSRPSSQTHTQSHRYSQSLSSTSEQSSSTAHPTHSSGALPSSPIKDSSTRQRPHTATVPTATSRRRSTTIIPAPLSPSLSSTRETPLLLRQPISRPNSSVGPPDPFLTGWGTGAGTHMNIEPPESGTLSVAPAGLRRTPSTSSESTSSLSHSASASRLSRQRAGTAPPPASRALTANSTSSSLPPPSAQNRLLRRLSSTFFNNSSSATQVSPPVEPFVSALNSTANLSSFLHSGAGTSSPATSDTSSPRWSREYLPGADGARSSVEVFKPKSTQPPIRAADEPPDAYLKRLVETVSKAEVAFVLAASGDAFHTQALRLYIDRFDFLDDPLDVALRKLLMELGLPRETQQIDRVMEAFAARYVGCNPGLFVNDDHPYILAFSLIMLHTDAFNKSNKNKMTKADYVKNTRLDGVPPEILECFFDNIVFAPFIFIEDPMDANAPKGYLPEGTARLSSIAVPTNNSSSVVSSGVGSTILGKTNKIDPYYLITRDLLRPLRAEVYAHIPRANPFLFEGTDWPWDTRRLHLLFALAQVIQVGGDSSSLSTTHNGSSSGVSTPVRRKSIALPLMTVGYGPFMGSPPPFNSEILPLPPRMPAVATSRGSGVQSVRITIAQVLARKEDSMEGGKKSTNRKWREWSVVLTGSQLLFFRDLTFASQLIGRPPVGDMHVIAPETGLLNPDELVSLHDCVAVFDKAYTKYSHTFRLFMPNGRQFLLQAANEKSLNEWISTINYACTFKTAGVQMRGVGMSYKEVVMTGVAAATSHLQDLRMSSKVSQHTLVHTYESRDDGQDLELSPSLPPSSGSSPKIGPGSKLLKPFNSVPNQVDTEVSLPRQLEDAQQFKATFDEVKAELAGHGTEQLQPTPSGRVRTLSMGARPNAKPKPKPPSRPGTAGAASRSEDMQHSTSQSRSDVIQSRVDNLDSKISHTQRKLDSELRIARNLAILTPFQRTTRDRIQMAVGPLAKKVRSIRVELTKLVCYRFVLLTDLADEERQWEQVKRDALQAATQKLSTTEDRASQPLTEHPPVSMPRPRAEPSVPESFYSALDTAEGNHSGNLSTPLSMLSEDDTTDFPFPPLNHSDDNRDSNTTPTRSPSNLTLSDMASAPVVNGHERFYTAAETPEEIAEVWNETRAAKRVSLVKLPSDVKLSAIRHARHPEDSGHRA